MSHKWQIEHKTLHDRTDVTVRNVTSQHIPLRLNGAKEANSILIQLLRCAGFAEEAYPYQRYHSNHGWGPMTEGLGIVIRQRHRNGEVPEQGDLYELAADTETQLIQAARKYAPVAQYLASPASQPDLSTIEADIDALCGASQDNRARLDNLADRTVSMLEELSELRGNVGELINTRPSVDEDHASLRSQVRRLWSRSETVYDTLYHGGNGVLTRINTLEGSRQDMIDLPMRVQALETALYRLITALNEDPGTQTNYIATLAGADDEEACLLDHEAHEEQVEYAAYLEREETTDAEAGQEASCEDDNDQVPV